MPFAFQGVCYATGAEALEAFAFKFPLIGDANWTAHVSSSINTTGLISYSVLTRPITSNTVSSRTGTLQLVSCTEVTTQDFDPVVGGQFFAVAFVGVLGTWILAQNIGLILEAIKKW